jgi:hypothetical protein
MCVLLSVAVAVFGLAVLFGSFVFCCVFYRRRRIFDPTRVTRDVQWPSLAATGKNKNSENCEETFHGIDPFLWTV